MEKGKIIFYDDDIQIIDQFKALIAEEGFDVVTANTLDDLRKIFLNSEIMSSAQALIFDLAKDNQEAGKHTDFEVVKDIKHQFNNLRLPIFIHSAYATMFPEFENLGTVWKIDKSAESLSKIVDTIKKLYDSGFLQLFCPRGDLEQTLLADLHEAFVEQFRSGEIEKIINNIAPTPTGNVVTRTKSVFKRLAVKSLMSKVLAPVSDVEPLNPMEHYYRRINLATFKIWTGDVLQNKENSKLYLVLSPRCNLANKKPTTILVCSITDDFPKDFEKVKSASWDHYTSAGPGFRHLPPSPIFSGGKVDLRAPISLDIKSVEKDYTILFSLSDDLTNEILGKLGAYFFRTGIPPFNIEEIQALVK